MASSATLVIDIVVNAAKAQSEMASTGGKFGQAMGKLAVPAAAVVTAIAGVAAASIDAASKTQQAFGGLDAVFGSNSAQVKDWANGAATSVGLSASSYAEFAAKIGSQLKNAGVPMDQIAGKTDEMIRLGSDLAATYGGSTADAVDALGASLRGEADPAERYGLALNQTAIKAQMAADGTDKLTGKAATQAKATTTLALATEQAGGAIGQFAREQDTAAGSAEIAAAQWENAKSALGTALLPVVAKVASVMGQLAAQVQKHPAVFQALAVVLGILAVAILVVNVAMALVAANPIVLVIVGIIAVVALLVVGIVMLWKKCDGFRNAVMAVWNAAKAAFNGIKVAVMAVVAAVVVAAAAIRNAFQAAWNAVKSAALAVGNFIVNYFKMWQAIARAVANGIKSAFTAAWNAIKSAASAVSNFVVSAFQKVTGPARSAANAVRAAFATAFNAVKSAASAVASFVTSAVRRPVSAAQSAASSIAHAFTSAFSKLRSAASGIAQALSAPFRAVAGAISSAISAVQSLIGWLSRIKVPSIKIPKGLSASSAAAPAGVRASTAPTLSRSAYAGRSVSAAAPPGTTIVVQGALDPDAVARQITGILRGADRRRRGVTLSQRAVGPAAA